MFQFEIDDARAALTAIDKWRDNEREGRFPEGYKAPGASTPDQPEKVQAKALPAAELWVSATSC